MKSLILLAIVGIAAASTLSSSEQGYGLHPLKWEPGFEYTYSYSGRLLTGIPELNEHHFSGIGIRCKVHLQVQNDYRMIVWVSDGSYSKVNREMSPSGGDQKGHNWRFLEMGSYSPIPSRSMGLLEKPAFFEVSEQTGKVQSVSVSEHEPEWSVNFKKALISLFQSGNVKPESIQTNEMHEGRQSGRLDVIPYVWTTFEQSPEGECETKYQMEEISASQPEGAEGEQLIPREDYCPAPSTGEEPKTYRLTKVRNLDNCIRTSGYGFYKPGHFSCLDHRRGGGSSCGSLWTRSSITRYVVCGTPDRFTIQSIVNEGEIFNERMEFKTEKMLTGSRQVLKLIHKGPIHSHVSQETGETVKHESLMYKFSKSEHAGAGPNSHPASILASQGELNKDELIREVEQMVREIVEHDLFTTSGLPEKQISFKVLTLSKAFKVFDRTMLKKVYDNLISESRSKGESAVMKNILVDTMVLSGTPESIRFFLSLVERGELSKSQMASIFFNLPRNVIIPSRYLLEELFEVVKSEQVRREYVVYSTAVLAYSNLLQKACLSRDRDVSYPTSVYGRFCSKESAIVTEKWIPYLHNELRSSSNPAKRNLMVVALGQLSHEQILPAVIPLIEEETAPHSRSNKHLARYLAVYALKKVGQHYPERVLPIVSAIYFNKAEPTDVRIAAFNIIMSLKPDMTRLQKIATATWYEKDTEVLRAVNTAFFSLTHQETMQDYKPESSILIRRARLLYPLIKKTGGRFPSSGTVYNTDYLERMKVGYELVDSWIASEDSVIPSYFYDKITYFMTEEYKYTPLELAVHLRDVFPNLYDSMSGTASTPVEEIKSKLTHEWRETIDKLRIKLRESGTPESYVFLNIFEDSSIFYSFSRSYGEEISKIMKKPSLLKEYLSGERSFNFQRVFDLTPSEGIIPSELGLPLMVTMNMPTVVSIRGRIESSVPIDRSNKISMTFKSLVDKRLIGTISTYCPFTGEYLATGIDEHTTMNVPLDWSLRVDFNEQKIESSINLASSSSGSLGKFDILYYRVVPFTVSQHLKNLKPIFSNEQFKIIKSRSPVAQKEYPIGEYLGLDLRVRFKTETPYLGLRYLLEKLYNLNYNPLNYARFHHSSILGLTRSGKPSVRRHEIRVEYNPESSSAKKVDVVLKLGYGIKEKNQPIVYKKLKVEAESEKPFEVATKPAGEFSTHRRRQQEVKSILEKLQVESEGRAIVLDMSASIIGRRPRTYTSRLVLGTGQSGLRQKWDLELKSQSGSSKKVCVSGEITIPTYSLWSIEQLRSESPVFHFENRLGYGEECRSQIVVSGNAQTSQQQKSLAMKTPEAKEYERLVQKGTPMIKLSKMAEAVRSQLSAIDLYRYEIKYRNVGVTAKEVTKQILEGLQVYWLPYSTFERSVYENLTPVRSSIESGSESFCVEAKSQVHPERNTFDIEITTTSLSEESPRFYYKDIPLPYPFPYMYPVSYTHDPVTSAIHALTGSPVYPICAMEGKYVSTFDNRTYKADVDDCFHLLSGDCSKAMQYGVLVRSLESSESKEVKILLEKASITMKPQGGQSVEVKVNQSPIQVPSAEWKVIKNSEGKIVGEIIKYKDNVVVFKSAKIGVYFDGKKIKLEGSNLLKNKLCGLCGDNNNKKTNDLLSPRQCLLSQPELVVASYRVGSLPSKQCRPLPESIRSKLQRESEQCVKPLHRFTQISESYGLHSSESECTVHHHEIIDKYAQREYCFSKIPILECGYKCHPVGVREKTINYTCMPKDRKSEYIAEKIRRGEVVPELRHMPTTFSHEREVPVECKPYGF